MTIYRSNTAWNSSSRWYDELLESNPDTYQKQVILPNLLRLLAVGKGEVLLDLACGQGFFAREFAKTGATVIGVDAAKSLIELAKKKGSPSLRSGSMLRIDYHVAVADGLGFLKTGSIDTVVIVLALQNIENIAGVFAECARVLNPHGRLLFVINHPAFRVPKNSSWGYDSERKMQYRRIDTYATEAKVKIQMRPGDAPEVHTLSFHRPLQSYFKALAKTGFAVMRLEEWNSYKKSEPGPRATAENRARQEIPLFLAVEAAPKGTA